MNTKAHLLVIIGGLLITLITGWIQGFLLVTNTGFHLLMGELLGASNYGLPLVWRTVIIYPGSPTNYNVFGLIVDIVVWVLIVWMVHAAGIRLRK